MKTYTFINGAEIQAKNRDRAIDLFIEQYGEEVVNRVGIEPENLIEEEVALVTMADGDVYDIEDGRDYQFTLGVELTVRDYEVRRGQFGRPTLFLAFNELPGWHLFQPLRMGLEEQYRIVDPDHAFEQEDGTVTDDNGNEVDPKRVGYASEVLPVLLEGASINVCFENLDDFENR